jgi:site-specific recombinase XerD
MLIDNGANLTAVSRRLGHSSTSITEAIYTRILEKKAEELNKIHEKCYQNVIKA